MIRRLIGFSALSVFLVTCFGFHPVQADGIDYSAAEATRSLPIGAAVWGELGFDALIWGEKKSAGDILYGYLRPAALLQTSAVVNRAEASLDFFPVSFFGVRFAASETLKLAQTSGMDCVSNLCTGELARESIRPTLLLGYQEWFLAATIKFEQESVDTQQSFVDESDVLVGAPGGDQLLGSDLWLGKNLNDRWAVGAHYGTARMIVAGDSNNVEDAFVRRKWGAWSGVLGMGSYQSDYQSRGFTAYLQLKWTGAASLGLF